MTLESWEAEWFSAEEPETITHVIIANEGQSGNQIRKKIRNAFDKVGYHISPVPKKLKGLTYLGDNSNPVETYIYNEYISVFNNALKEQGLKPLFAEVFNSYWDVPDDLMKHYNKVGWPAPDSTESFEAEYHQGIPPRCRCGNSKVTAKGQWHVIDNGKIVACWQCAFKR